MISDSLGIPEADLGSDGNAYVDSVYQLAVSEGVSLFVASGDSGAAYEDQTQNAAEHGITVNGLASTPDNVAVGGTDFADTYSNSNDTYWGTNGANLQFGALLHSGNSMERLLRQ